MDKTQFDALLAAVIEKPSKALLDNLKKVMAESGAPLSEDVSAQLEIF